jgi:hypothetical protein
MILMTPLMTADLTHADSGDQVCSLHLFVKDVHRITTVSLIAYCKVFLTMKPINDEEMEMDGYSLDSTSTLSSGRHVKNERDPSSFSCSQSPQTKKQRKSIGSITSDCTSSVFNKHGSFGGDSTTITIPMGGSTRNLRNVKSNKRNCISDSNDDDKPEKKPNRSMETTFKNYYEQLKTFKSSFGHTKVTPKYDKKLARYCAEIKNAKRHPDTTYGRKFRDEHFKAFDDLGFLWDSKKEGDEKSFEVRIQQLKAFKVNHGHVRPTKKYDSNLAHFCANIRKARRNPERAIRITEDRIKALDEIGFEWNPKPSQGDINFWGHIEKLKAFRKKHGHSLVTHKHDKQLAVFCNNLRVTRRGSSTTTRRLNADRIRSLDELDFVWEPGIGKTAVDFTDMLEQLKEFKKIHGHFFVTPEAGSQKLTDFCSKMRIAFHKPGTGLASVDRIRSLAQIGFDWEPQYDHFFDACFEKVKTIRDAGGDIYEAEKANDDLARFAKSMRSAHIILDLKGRSSIASCDRIQAMEDLGFKWIL